MKVFAATFASALVGAAWAAPAINTHMANGFNSNSLNQLRGGSQMSGRQMSERQMSDRQMSDTEMSGRQMSNHHMSGRQMSDRQMTPMDLALRKMSPHMSPADRMSLAEQKTSRRNMYGHQMSRSQLAERKMSMLDGSRRMSSFDDDAAQGSQYYKHTDGLGNYVYGYSYGTQEKFEEGSPETGVKGHYTFVDANGVSKRVDYVADKEGFRVLNDDGAVPSNRFRREVSPEPIRTRMSSYMDALSLPRDLQDKLSSTVGREMYDRMMGQDLMGRGMIGQDAYANLMTRRNLMSRRNMINRNVMDNDRMGVLRMYGNEMNVPAIGMDGNMQDRNTIGLSHSLLGQRHEMSSTMPGGQDVMGNRMNAYSNGMDGTLLQHHSIMGQRMEMERIPDNRVMAQLF